MATTNVFSENISAWVAAGWRYEIAEVAGVWTARLILAAAIPYSVTGGSMLIAATILANTVPATVVPPA